MPETIYTIDMLIQKILDEEKPYDLDKIIESYKFAETAHADQKRSSGEPYISHPVAVAFILIELGMDTDTICAAMLHDVVEDTDITLETVEKKFGKDIAMLVDGVTKLSKMPISHEEMQAENVRKMLLAMSRDVRVIIIKLCDRLHNMRTLKYTPKHKQREKALETMNVFAPLAHRLGIRAVKDELEDLAFYYLDSFAYAEIEHILEIGKDAREEFIATIKERVSQRLSKEEFSSKPQVDGRVKTIYGIYKKIFVDGKSIDQIYDKYAIRVIVDSINECYNVLGIIHDMFKPIPNRFKDYISTPKANMYQSLHTTVLGREGIPFEVQIRTWDMHYTAEYGIAAHWKYKEGIQGKDKLETRLAWIRQVLESQKESDDIEEIVRTIKNDLAIDEVFAFTPKGDMISLPAGGTVIDFAYKIHTQVGNRMMGAKVDGKMVRLDYKLKTGEIVEILTTKAPDHGPGRDWIDIAKTNEAKSKIRGWFKRERHEENVAQGKSMLESEFKRNRMIIAPEELEEFLSDELKRRQCTSLEDYYAKIGYGGLILSKLMPRLKELYVKTYSAAPAPDFAVTATPVRPSKKGVHGVIVEGIDNCLVKFSQCCNPLPGEDIIGFVTRGHGVSVHKKDCVNYISSCRDAENASRWVNCYWADSATSEYRTTLDVTGYDRNGLLLDVCSVFADLKVPLNQVTAREVKNGCANIMVTFNTTGVDQLNLISNRISRLNGIISIQRTGK